MCGPFAVFNGEEVLTVVVSFANSHLDEYQTQKVILLLLGQKYKFSCMYCSAANDLGLLNLISAAELIAHNLIATLPTVQLDRQEFLSEI